jgi:hypothetical protein
MTRTPPFPRFFMGEHRQKAEMPDPSTMVVVDRFNLNRPGDPSPSTWLVAMGKNGESWLFPDSARGEFSLKVQRAVAHNALAFESRTISAAAMHLLVLDQLGTAGDLPGANDPIEDHGTLWGPFPGNDVHAQRGILSTTHADVLEGLVRGAWHAFHPVGEAGGGQTRSYHAMLAGGDEEEMAKGEGLILALPASPWGVSDADSGNALACTQLLFQILNQMKASPDAPGSLHSEILPVPSRGAYEARLRSQGFEIGDAFATKSPFQNSILGWLF